MTVTVDTIDMGVRYTHDNGNVLEVVGERDDGEWFCTDAAGNCYAQGYYNEDDDDVVTMSKNVYTTYEEAGVLAQLRTNADWTAWAETMLAKQ